MKKILFALLAFSLAATVVAQKNATEKPYALKGVIKDKNSAVFAGTTLYFKNKDKETFVSTDVNGEFTVELAPGNYEVTVRKEISETFKAYIVIEKNGLNPNNVEFVVEPNPVCCGASGEKPYPKATKLIKPPYPAAARAVRAGGEVVVQVKIDKDGKVIDANAVSGHPLLRYASVIAAKSSEFAPSASDDPREAKLTYVFVEGLDEKPNIKRYSNAYRVEVIGVSVPLDFTTTAKSF